MSKQSPFILAVLFVVGCGNQISDKDRPVDANNTNNNGTTNPNNSTGANNGVTNGNNGVTNANNGATTGNNGTTANNGVTTANNGTTNNGTTNTNSNNTPGDCAWDDQFFGQIGGFDEHGGGVPTPVALSNDAGLDAVASAVPTTPNDPATIPDEGYVVLNTPLYVSGATVTSTAGGLPGNRRFWVEDRNTAIQVFALLEFGQVKVGDKLSFYVRALQNFEGHPQIAELDTVSFDSGNNPVPYRDVNNRALVETDYGRVVRFAGRLGTPYDCGGTNCYDFTYPGGTTTLRSKSMFATPGSCVQWSGPAYAFPGPLNAAGSSITMQADTINYDWAFFE